VNKDFHLHFFQSGFTKGHFILDRGFRGSPCDSTALVVLTQSYCTFWEIIHCSLQQSADKDQQESRAIAEKPHDAVVKFDTYQIVQRHRAVLPLFNLYFTLYGASELRMGERHSKSIWYKNYDMIWYDMIWYDICDSTAYKSPHFLSENWIASNHWAHRNYKHTAMAWSPSVPVVPCWIRRCVRCTVILYWLL